MSAEGTSAPTRKRQLEENDAETESILKIMRLHAEHRGPREIAMHGDNLTRRYFRSRSYRVTPNIETHALNSSVPKDYVCHMCGDKGHHIRLCPLKGDRFRKQTKKIKTASGIPRSWLKFIDPSEISQFDSVYCLPTGQLAVLKQEHSNVLLDDLSAELRCPLCSESFKNPTIVSCCGTSFCYSCIEAHVGRPCPACFQRGLLKLSDLQPNTAIATLSKSPPPDSSSSFGNHQPRPISDVKPPPPKREEEAIRDQKSAPPKPPSPSLSGPVVLSDYASPFMSLLNLRPK